MKTLILCILSVLLFGCNAQVESKKNMSPPDSVDFSWIRSAKELKLETVNIYYKGTAKGEFVGAKQWQGKITGEIFCKPLAADRLKDGLYIKNGTIKVNKDSTIQTGVLFNNRIISFDKKTSTFQTERILR
jgi:hypothetical protein